jgi:hypothetical protein
VYYNGTSVCTIVPSVGYSISSVLIDGTTPVTGTSYIFANVQANHTISASFTAWPSWASPELGTDSGITNPVIVDPNTGAWAEQVNVRTASNGAGSLVVWSERDVAGMGDIRGARLDVNGNVLDPDGFLIFSSTGDQRVPDVVWDGQNYFVVWESRDVDAGDIYGVHVSADGVVDSTVVPIAVGYAQQGYPSVEFDGTQYLVAWHGYAATPLPSTAAGIYATAVSREGVVRTPGGFLLVDAPNGQAYPDIAFAPASQTYLVVWGDHRRTAPNPTPPPDTHEWPPYDVYGMRLQIDANGTPTFLDSLTASLPIHVGEQCDRRPRIATDGTSFLVVDSCVNGPGTWDRTTVRMSALAHRVSADGTVSAVIDVSGGIGDVWGTSVAYTNPNYFVAWVDGATAPPQLLAKRVSPSGAVLDGSAAVVALDPRFALEAPPPDGRLIFTSHISFNRSRTGEALVGYTREQTPGGTTRVRARLVDVEHEPAAYTITASAGTGGSIVPSGTLTANRGGNASFSIDPDPGYQILSVIVDGTNRGALNSYTFTNVQANHTIAVYFKAVSYTITATAGANGAISSPGVNTVSPGSTMSFTITPNAGYHIADVLVDTVSSGPTPTYVFTDIQANHTIAASFASNASYTINASAGANGSISPSGAVSALGGTNGQFTMSAEPGYRVADVVVDESSVGARTSYTFYDVQAAHTISASFTPDVYTITASVTNYDSSTPGNGSITVNGSAPPAMVNAGASITYTVTPNAGYVVYSVLVDGTQKGGITSYTFSDVKANHTIDAYVRPITYTITASAGPGGSISHPGVNTVNSGSDMTFAITPNPGYHIDDVLVDGVSAGAVATYPFSNVTDNHTISATFAANSGITITASAGPNGSITPSGAVPVNAGASQKFTFTPQAGYRSAVVVDGSPMGALTSYTFTNVQAAHTIDVTFVLDVYNIIVTAATGGSVTVTGTAITPTLPVTVNGGESSTITVNPGANVTLNIAPDAGRSVRSLVDNGSYKYGITTYTLTNITKDHTINVYFK